MALVPEDQPLPKAKVLDLDKVREVALDLGETTNKPFVVVGEDVYCTADRFQCTLAGKVTDVDAYHYFCPECQSRYRVAGQDFVDWCKLKEQGIDR